MSTPMILTGIFIVFISLTRNKFNQIHQRMVASLSVFLVLFHTNIINYLFQPLNCMKQTDGRSFLFAYPSQQCFGASWQSHIPAVLFFGLLYGLLPVILLALFLKSKYISQSRILKLCLPAITYSFRTEVDYWELVRVLFKTILAGFRDLSFIDKDVRFTLATFLLILLLLCEMIILPYRSKRCSLLSVQ
jgi:hypothetical protein